MKLLLFSLFISIVGFAQMPETDIWLVNIIKKNEKYTYKNPINITKRLGYDNQPCFSVNNKDIYFVSVKENNQADIFQYSIKKNVITQFTKTDESEYSPNVSPDKNYLTCVVVLKDSSQQLFNYSLEKNINPIKISIDPTITDSVGYYTWLTKDTILYYKLTNPHSLRAWNIKTKKDVWLCNNPTRAFKKIDNSSQFIYGIKDSVSVSFRIYNPILKESSVFATYPSTNEDFIWHEELGLIKSENANLLRYNEKNKLWEVLFSFSNLGIKKITRFVFDSKTKRLAIVSNL